MASDMALLFSKVDYGKGTHKVVTKGNDDWEVHYEGKFEFIGGTGKFKNLKGGGTYKGHITPKGLTEEDEAEVTY